MTDSYYPVDIVLAPEWWHSEAGLTFDEDFFYHPIRRVEAERRMEEILFDRWGRFGLGAARDEDRPEAGAVHLAAGFLLSELLGCDVEYSATHPPQVNPLGVEKLSLDEEEIFRHPRFTQFEKLLDTLEERYGYLCGDVNWGGVLNIALDLRGETLFLDALDTPEELDKFFEGISRAIDLLTGYIERRTGTTSISVNRTIAGLDRRIRLHSECTHTMVSEEFYRAHLMRFDAAWSRGDEPYGIHYCGNDPHRFAEAWSELPRLNFLDVGWGGDVAALRRALPATFLNIRLDPVSLVHTDETEIHRLIYRLAAESGDPRLTGFCCINIDDSMPEKNITAIFQAVEEIKARAAADQSSILA